MAKLDTEIREVARLIEQALHVWLTEGTRSLLRKTIRMGRSVLHRRLGWKQPAHPEAATALEQIMTGGDAVSLSPTRAAIYQLWTVMGDLRETIRARTQGDHLAYNPTISIIMPVYNTEACVLEHALRSVRAQIYPKWELCICDDASPDPHVRQRLEAARRRDPRIKIKYREQNGGIATASNDALSLATGEFVTFMDHDDEIAPHALDQVVRLLNRHPDADLIYSDEDKIGAWGRRYEPFFKPDWSPDFFLSSNYLCHFTHIRASLVREAGGFRPGYEGSQDYDLYLRVIERTDKIYHIPKLLYHWRAIPTSTASDPQAKAYAHVAARRALEDHLRRRQIDATVLPANGLGRWRIKYAVPHPFLVSVIVPTANAELLRTCLDGLAEGTRYPDFEIVVVDNSKDGEVEAVFSAAAGAFGRTRYLDWRNRPFNFSAMNNDAAQVAQSPLLLLLNDDITPLNADWLEAMVEHAQRPEVGAVGAKLLFPDGTFQHGGVVLGIHGNSGHAFKYLPADEQQPYYFGLPHVVRNCSAVTGACLMTRRETLWEAGGFDEVHLAVAFQDVDLCLKMRAQGYLIVYTPHAQLIHAESKTRAHVEKTPSPYEVRYMQKKWSHVIARDPYYNPNLTRLNESFSLALPR